MADNPEVIRQQMEETKAHLADKLAALENQVSDTVQSTTSTVSETVEAVSETVEAVKETVENVSNTFQETVQAVGETFDLRLQTERHPWLVFGGAVALGCAAAQLLGDHPVQARQGTSPYNGLRDAAQEARPTQGNGWHPSQAAQGWLWEMLGHLRGLAVGSLMRVVHDLAERGLPGPLGQRIAEEVDQLTPKLGGELIREPLLPSGKE